MPRARKPPSAPEGTVWFGGDVERVSICLRVLGDELDPHELTGLLRREPTRAGRKGEPVSRPNGEISRYRRKGVWILDHAPPPDSTVEEAILALLRELPSDESLWRSLTQRYQIDLLCHVIVRGVNQGFVLAPEVLDKVARLGIPLGFDIFVESDDEQAANLTERLNGSAERE